MKKLIILGLLTATSLVNAESKDSENTITHGEIYMQINACYTKYYNEFPARQEDGVTYSPLYLYDAYINKDDVVHLDLRYTVTLANGKEIDAKTYLKCKGDK